MLTRFRFLVTGIAYLKFCFCDCPVERTGGGHFFVAAAMCLFLALDILRDSIHRLNSLPNRPLQQRQDPNGHKFRSIARLSIFPCPMSRKMDTLLLLRSLSSYYILRIAVFSFYLSPSSLSFFFLAIERAPNGPILMTN